MIIREVAEELAGPHWDSCDSVTGVFQDTSCSCAWEERVTAIEAALREAEERGRNDQIDQCETHLAEARRAGREEMREQAAQILEPWPQTYGNAPEVIRALPLEGTGKEE